MANHKKAENEIVRNSLVVESIHIIQKIKPRFFIFENVAAFMKTGCTAPDGTIKTIGEVIEEELGDNYIISSRILNFKNYEIYKELPVFNKEEIFVLEPSVGVGNFIPFVFKKYEDIKHVHLDVVDIDEKNLIVLKLLLEKQGIPKNFDIRYINADTLLYPFEHRYDLVVGNPPFSKLKAKDAEKYLQNNYNQETTNTFEFFLEKALMLGDYVAMIMPKAVLNTPEFSATRELLSGKKLRYHYSLKEMRPIDSLDENTIPILLIHGAGDELIPPRNSEDMAKRTKGYCEIHLIPDAGHAESILTAPENYKEYVRKFLEKVMAE